MHELKPISDIFFSGLRVQLKQTNKKNKVAMQKFKGFFFRLDCAPGNNYVALIRFIDSLGWNVKHDLKKKKKRIFIC